MVPPVVITRFNGKTGGKSTERIREATQYATRLSEGLLPPIVVADQTEIDAVVA